MLGHLGATTIRDSVSVGAGEAHLVKMLTSTGTTFEHEIAVARRKRREPTARAPRALRADRPVRRRAPGGDRPAVVPAGGAARDARGLDFLLALTVGLLLFLLVDAAQEGLEAAAALPGSYQGAGAASSARPSPHISALEVVRASGCARAARGAAGDADARAAVLALLIAVGIGLHNFGEGLAIGAAFALGEAALGTLLIIGFTLHNTTEGLAIVAPLAKERPSIGMLVKLGLIGGVPTIAGAWLGGFVYSPRGRRAVPRRSAPARSRRSIHPNSRQIGRGDRAAAVGAIRHRADHVRPAGRLRGDVCDRDAGWLRQLSWRRHSLSWRPARHRGGRVRSSPLVGAEPLRAAREIHVVVRDMTFYVDGQAEPNPDAAPAPRRARAARAPQRGRGHDARLRDPRTGTTATKTLSRQGRSVDHVPRARAGRRREPTRARRTRR